MSKIENLMAGARDAITVKRVYGDPYTKDGVTVIPAASVRGGGGGGEGDAGDGQPGGAGGGFGLMARPVGAFQIKGEEVTWIPAADTTRVIMMGQLVAIVALFVIRAAVKNRRSRR